MGIAFNMIPVDVWANPGCKTHGNFDRAGFYPTPPAEFKVDYQEAVSITNVHYPMEPYLGYEQLPVGLAFHISNKSQFWKYFQVALCGDKKAGDNCSFRNDRKNPVYGPCGSWDGGNNVIVGGPGDGLANHPSETCRQTLAVQGKSYAWFTQQKNYILSLYKKVYPTTGLPYNEFDTNGVSPCDLAGVFYYSKRPWPDGFTDAFLCRFLTYANPKKKTWPIFNYDETSLTISKTLSCKSNGIDDSSADLDELMI